MIPTKIDTSQNKPVSALYREAMAEMDKSLAEHIKVALRGLNEAQMELLNNDLFISMDWGGDAIMVEKISEDRLGVITNTNNSIYIPALDFEYKIQILSAIEKVTE